MPARQPKYMDEVRTNSGGLYVALYYLSEKVDAASVAVDKWFWLRSNASGVKLDERDNKIPVNGASWWSEKSTALANTPSGYGSVSAIDEFQNKREWGYKPDFPFDSGFVAGGTNVSLNNAFADITQFVNAGATYVALTLNWDDVFLTLSEQNTNADSSWARYDALINFVKNLNSTTKVAIRISVYKAGRTHNDMQGSYNPTGNLWPLSKTQKDNRGNVMRNIYDRGTFSYSDSSATSQAIDFVTKVKNRYSASLGSRLHWISVATTTQEEAGYDYENQWDGSNYYSNPQKRVYDYSDASKTAFTAFCLAKYGSLSAVNTAWGFPSSTSITPPLPPTENTDEGISLVYSNIKGNDWWYFNYSVMKAFHTSCKAAIGSACKYVLEFGSCSDALSVRRLSINVADFPNYSDMLKAQFISVLSNINAAISVDVIRANYTKKIGTELNTADFNQYSGEGNISNFIKNAGIAAIDNKALDIMIISSSTSGAYNKQAYDDTYNAFVFLKNYAQNSPYRVVASKTVNYSITQQLNDSTFLLRKWQQEGGNSTRIDLKISDINVTPPVDCNYALQIYPIQTYCLSNNNILIDAYDNDTALQDVMKNTHFKLWLPTHSISYISGQLTLVSYTVTGADGVVYVKNTQNQGFYTDNQTVNVESPYRNNHPLKQYSGVVTSSIVLLPLGQTYTIQMTNLTPTNQISFVVQNLDINPQADSPTVFQRKVGSTPSSFTFNPNIITSNFIRQVKFNCNRYTDTDTIVNIG
jgi:hypothetical protein